MRRGGVLEGMGERSASGRYGRLDDTRLAALVRKGDMGAFEALYDRHHAPLLAFCRHMCGSHQDGEDVLQQTFLRAHRALERSPGAGRDAAVAVRDRPQSLPHAAGGEA